MTAFLDAFLDRIDAAVDQLRWRFTSPLTRDAKRVGITHAEWLRLRRTPRAELRRRAAAVARVGMLVLEGASCSYTVMVEPDGRITITDDHGFVEAYEGPLDDAVASVFDDWYGVG